MWISYDRSLRISKFKMKLLFHESPWKLNFGCYIISKFLNFSFLRENWDLTLGDVLAMRIWVSSQMRIWVNFDVQLNTLDSLVHLLCEFTIGKKNFISFIHYPISKLQNFYEIVRLVIFQVSSKMWILWKPSPKIQHISTFVYLISKFAELFIVWEYSDLTLKFARISNRLWISCKYS